MKTAIVYLIGISLLSSALLEAKPKDPKINEFNLWHDQFSKGDAQKKAELLPKGKELAMERRAVMRHLMRQDPKESLESAFSYEGRKRLPDALKPFIEKWISDEGTLDVTVAIAEEGNSSQSQHYLTVGETIYKAHLFGRNVNRSHVEKFLVNGIALDGEVALDDQPVRRLTQEEMKDLIAEGKIPQRRCPVSKKLMPTDESAEGGAALVGGEIIILCSGGHIETLQDSYAQDGGGVTGNVISTRPLSWTTGTKTVLFIRVNYPDDFTDPQSEASALAGMASMSQFMMDSSYQRLNFVTTVTPLLTLPKTKAAYIAMGDDDGSMAIRADALVVAKNAGYDYLKYQLDVTRYNGGPGYFGGQAWVGTRGVWMKTNAVGTLAHEFGHNLGAWHSNYFAQSGSSLSGSGTNQEYGDIFDVMGSSGSFPNGHFNAYWKSYFGWIPSTHYITMTQRSENDPLSEVWRISAFDKTAPLNLPFALRLKVGTVRQAWFEHRQRTTSPYLLNGLLLHLSPFSLSNRGTELIDTTPGSAGGKNDAAIAIGTSYTDPKFGIAITPLGKTGTIPESIDVRVDFDYVAPIITAVSLSPTSALMALGQQRQFSANVYDQFGAAVPNTPVDWSSTCGTVNSSGLYTAPLSAGTCYVKASKSGVMGQVTVTVYSAILTSIALSPATVTLTVGKAQQFTATPRDQYGYTLVPAPPFLWSVNGCGSMSISGLFTAQASGKCIATVSSGAVSSTAAISVSAAKGGGRAK